MGSSKKPTLGYWYPRVLHFGVSLPVDADHLAKYN